MISLKVFDFVQNTETFPGNLLQMLILGDFETVGSILQKNQKKELMCWVQIYEGKKHNDDAVFSRSEGENGTFIMNDSFRYVPYFAPLITQLPFLSEYIKISGLKKIIIYPRISMLKVFIQLGD